MIPIIGSVSVVKSLAKVTQISRSCQVQTKMKKHGYRTYSVYSDVFSWEPVNWGPLWHDGRANITESNLYSCLGLEFIWCRHSTPSLVLKSPWPWSWLPSGHASPCENLPYTNNNSILLFLKKCLACSMGKASLPTLRSINAINDLVVIRTTLKNCTCFVNERKAGKQK